VAAGRRRFYSASIDTPNRTEDHTMNSFRTLNQVVARLSSVALAAVITFGMLGGVNALAVSDAPAELLARTAAAHQQA
jgi:hypothetical protein